MLGFLAAGIGQVAPGCARLASVPESCASHSSPASALPELETLDRFEFEGSEPTMASRIVVDGAGGLFYSCYVGAPVYTQWLVRKSSDEGRTWANSDSFHTGAGQWNYPTGIAADSDGNLFVSGVSEDLGGIFAMVRKSTDHGATWTTAARYRKPGSAGCKSYNVKSFGGGLVFTLGRHAGGVLHWLIRRSTDGGVTWADVDDPHATESYTSKVLDMARARNGDLVAFGFLDSASKEAWLFRRSSDDGGTWTDLSSDHTQAGFTDVAGGLTATASGALIAAGWTIDPQGPIRALLRKSTDSGATWSTVDDYQLDSRRTLYQGVVEDSRGRLLALATQAIEERADAGPARGMIRMSCDGGESWQDFVELRGTDGVDATYTSLFLDASDQLFVSGRHGDAAIVQRMRLPAPVSSAR